MLSRVHDPDAVEIVPVTWRVAAPPARVTRPHSAGHGDEAALLRARIQQLTEASEEQAHQASEAGHRAGEIAGQHLLGLGHRRFGAIVGSGLEGVQVGRLAGFRSALEAQGLRLDDSLVRNVDDSVATSSMRRATVVSGGRMS